MIRQLQFAKHFILVYKRKVCQNNAENIYIIQFINNYMYVYFV